MAPEPAHRPVGAHSRPMAHRLRGRFRRPGPARAGRGPRPLGRAGLAVHHPAAMASAGPLRRDRHVPPGYRAAIRTGLPNATIVVDHFHVVQLANKMLSTVRRRATALLRGRRGRACDPRSGRLDPGFCATGRTSPTPSSARCGTRWSTPGRSG
ncbi:transposase [Streptomyces sp. NPDC002838]|uniref:transposase n=1 Tax=Streptomyces sp. NPDC002838 TaxID=3154436 RepID=UPI00332923F7